jgi:ABC-type bacteriocin/lantibiotic exporter with double-glycine peptidase domain
LAAAPGVAGCNPLGMVMSEQALLRSGKFDLIEGLRVPEVSGPAGCGAQALACLINYADPSRDARSECDSLPFHDAGANAIDVLLAARGRGMKASVSRGTWDSLAAFVEERQPVMVMFDRNLRALSPVKPPEIMHWAVVSGMSRDRTRLLCAAPGGRHHVIDRRVFLDCWASSDNCTIVVAGAAPRSKP